jgi:hypothetical protein
MGRFWSESQSNFWQEYFEDCLPVRPARRKLRGLIGLYPLPCRELGIADG